jgi:two-component system, OmpR family, alkaline phosphatase synthesis response regulator PhoP
MDENKKIKTILVVEDDENMTGALVDKFTAAGFTMLSAKNGEEGLFIALEKHPDLILLDIVMPKIDGLAMLRKLREDRWGMHAPVVILTNLSDNAKLAEALEIGVVEYIIKAEVKLSEIVNKVKRVLGVI